MLRRRRTLGLALLALLAPLPAFAISELTPSSESQVAQLSVSASLESCGLHETQLVCTLGVSFEAIPEATGYTASVTRADGSVIDAGSVSPGGSSLYVPYVGSGTYSVRVTAYGEPAPVEETGDEVKPEVIATDAAATEAGDEGRDDDRELEAGTGATVESETGPRGELPGGPANPAGETETAPECSDTAAAAGTELPPLPEPPPEDLDPNNPDEDADLILDEDERLAYEQAVADREAAEQAQAQAPAGC
jgi:hypothetical protein